MARPRSEAARAKMLEAAAKLVMTAGVHGFSIDEVARRSGVAKTTIYRHFCSANELLVAAFDRTLAPFPAPDNGTLAQDLIEFMSTLLPALSDPPLRQVMLDVMSAAARDPELQQIHQAVVEQRLRPLRLVLERAKERGEISDRLGFDEAIAFVEGPFLAHWFLRPETLGAIDVEAYVDRVIMALKS